MAPAAGSREAATTTSARLTIAYGRGGICRRPRAFEGPAQQVSPDLIKRMCPNNVCLP